MRPKRAALAAMALGCALTATAQYSYTAINLTARSGNAYGYAYAVNNQGDVGGAGFIYNYGAATFTSYGGATVAAINNPGVGAGDVYYNNLGNQVSSFSNGIVTPLGPIPSTGSGINDSGQVAGTISSRAYVFSSNGTYTEIPLPAGTANASDINNAGQVVGSYGVYSNAYLYSGGTLTNLHPLIGGAISRAQSISEAGHVTGYFTDATGLSHGGHAFLYSNGAAIDLGVLPGHEFNPLTGGSAGNSLSTGNGVNSSGWVVGYSRGQYTTQTAFVYRDGAMFDLNAITDFGNSGITSLAIAYGISDTGFIVGVGSSSLGTTAFLLVPTASAIPEPSTYAAIVGALVLAGACVWRKRQSPRVIEARLD